MSICKKCLLTINREVYDDKKHRIRVFCMLIICLIVLVLNTSSAWSEEYPQRDTFISCVQAQDFDEAWDSYYISDSNCIIGANDTELVGAAAYLLYQRQETEAAEQLLKLVLLMDRRFNYEYLGLLPAHRMLGYYCMSNVFYADGKPTNYQISINSLSRVYLEDTTIDVGNALACAYASQAQIDNDSVCMRKAIEIENELLMNCGSSTEINYNMGRFYHYLDEDDSALYHLNRVLLVDSNACPVFYELGNIYKKQRNYEKAIEMYSNIIKFEDDARAKSGEWYVYSGMGYYQLACCYALNGLDVETVRVLNEAKSKRIIFSTSVIMNDNDFDLIRNSEIFVSFIENECGDN